MYGIIHLVTNTKYATLYQEQEAVKLLTIPDLAKELDMDTNAGRVRIWRMVRRKQIKPATITPSGMALFDADHVEEIRKLVLPNGNGK